MLADAIRSAAAKVAENRPAPAKAPASKPEAPKAEPARDQVKLSQESREARGGARPAFLTALHTAFAPEASESPKNAAQKNVTQAPEPEKTSTRQPDGSVADTQTVTHPDGSRDVETIVTRPDGTRTKSTAHSYTSDQNLEELKGDSIEGREHPQGAPDSGYRDAPAGVSPDARRDKTQVVETRTVAIGPDGQETELETTVSYSQKVHVDGGDLPYGATVDPNESGLILSHVEKTTHGPNGETHGSVDGSELKIVGTRPDGSKVSATRSDVYDHTNGQLTTQKEVTGYKRAELQYLTENGGVSARVGGREMSVTPQGLVSERTPTDHLQKAGKANDFMGVGEDQPLDVRVTVTQDPSSGKKPSESIEMGNYAHPEKDGKTLVRTQDSDGSVHWTYQKTSNQGQDSVTQDVIEGSDYNHVQAIHRGENGTYSMTDDVHLGDRHVSHRAASRSQTAPGPVASFQDHFESWNNDPQSGVRLEETRADSTEIPSTGYRKTSVYSKKLVDTLPLPDFKNPRSLVYDIDKATETVDPSSANPVSVAGSHVTVTDVDRVLSSSDRAVVFNRDGHAFDAQGHPLATPALDFSSPDAFKESLGKLSGPLGDSLRVPGLQALGAVGGLFTTAQGVANLDPKQTLKGLGQAGQGAEGLGLVTGILESEGVKKTGSLGQLGELTLAKKFGALGGLLSTGVGLFDVVTGKDGWDKVGGGIDALAGTLAVAGLFYPPLAVAGGLVSLGKLGYDYLVSQIRGSSTPDLDGRLA